MNKYILKYRLLMLMMSIVSYCFSYYGFVTDYPQFLCITPLWFLKFRKPKKHPKDGCSLLLAVASQEASGWERKSPEDLHMHMLKSWCWPQVETLASALIKTSTVASPCAWDFSERGDWIKGYCLEKQRDRRLGSGPTILLWPSIGHHKAGLQPHNIYSGSHSFSWKEKYIPNLGRTWQYSERA